MEEIKRARVSFASIPEAATIQTYREGEKHFSRKPTFFTGNSLLPCLLVTINVAYTTLRYITQLQTRADNSKRLVSIPGKGLEETAFLSGRRTEGPITGEYRFFLIDLCTGFFCLLEDLLVYRMHRPWHY